MLCQTAVVVVWFFYCFGSVVFLIEKMLFSKTFNIMNRGLDASSLRNEVIANNLANVDTPGFKRSDVSFEQELLKAMSGKQKLQGFVTNEKHIPIGGPSQGEIAPRVVPERTTSIRNDGNNVDIDREMAALAKNSIMYSALIEEINGEFRKIKTAIEGR